MKKWLQIFVIIIMVCISAGGLAIGYYNSTEGLRFVRGLGAGINLGNSLDVYNIERWKPGATIEEYQQAWSNPLISTEQLEDIVAAGFATVRIPTSWGDHLTDDGSIDPQWLERVDEIVRQSLDAGLNVILNTHHELWLTTSPDSAAEVEAQLGRIWQQVADNFADCDSRLLFEGMNEPRLRGSENEWKSGTAEERDVVNRLNAAFVKTVRSAAGYNAERYLIIGGYATNRYSEALSSLELPQNDSHIIVNIHAYYPYRFAQDTDGTDEWLATRESDTDGIDEMLALAKKLFIKRKIPVIISEFGAVDKNNLPARLAWADYYTNAAAKQGIPCIWWDDGKDFRLLDRSGGGWHFPELAELLVNNAP